MVKRLSSVRRLTTAEERRYWLACWATSVTVSFTTAASETRFTSTRALHGPPSAWARSR
jgi:hypothetical protein